MYADLALNDGFRIAEEEVWFAGYQEFLRKPVEHALQSRGKLLRPRILLAAHRAAGGSSPAIYRIAFAAEVAHIGSLVHDDIIDEDVVRRGQPSVHAKFGRTPALLTGDALFFQLFKTIAASKDDLDSATVQRVTEKFADLGLQLCAGEMLEYKVSTELDFSLERAEEVSELKTAAFFRCMCEVAAILADADINKTAALSGFGLHLGLAFQAADDALPFLQTDKSTGKPGLSDLRNSRPSHPVVNAYQNAEDSARGRIRTLMQGRGGTLDDRWAELCFLVDSHHGLKRTAEYVKGHCEAAMKKLQSVNVESEIDELISAVRSVMNTME